MASSKRILNIGETPPEDGSPDEPAPRALVTDAVAGASASVASGTEIREIIVRQGSGWQTTALLFLSLLLATTVAVAFYAFHRVAELNDEMSTTMHRVEQKIQSLDAGISFDSKRQQLLLGIRDEIMRANPRVSLNEAYEYALLIMHASDKYPSVSPLMFLAIGIVESAYDTRATSHANAKGLYQIWPSTGRLLARSLDLEYSDEMLYDPRTNTELAALYLDILFSAYNDPNMVLAEYNGGPLNAGYYRAGSSYTALETKEYVQRVGSVYDALISKFEHGVEVSLMPMHKDRARAGKELGKPIFDAPTGRSDAEPRVQLAGQ
ncbi:MAG: lytic transglycosylase domain-containing protein [Vicinamibacteria bacterium]